MFKAPFSFHGRIRRFEYFISSLIFWIITIPAIILCAGLEAIVGKTYFITIIFCVVIYIANVWLNLAQTTKRFHDLDKTGWLYLLLFIPLVNVAVALYLLFADGTVGPNRYGLDPKNRAPYIQQPTSVNVTLNLNQEDLKSDSQVSAQAETRSQEEKPV